MGIYAMISIATHYNPTRAVDYFEHDLAIGGSLQPCWLGNFARMLGLEGYIPRHTESLTIFDRLARGCSPSGVTLLAGVMRYAERKRRTSYDIVVSAPKSVSIVALVAEDHRILDIHRRAVQTAFEEMQLRARISYRGFKHPTNALVAAHFVHTRSRERDPHLHSHLLSFNMTYCSDPGLYPIKALDPKRIFADSVQLDQIYKNDLAYGLRQLGHKVSFIAGSPEICSIENDQSTVFSKAHLKIDSLEQRLFGTKDNPYYRLWVNDRFRASKNHAEEKLSTDTVAEHWRSEMSQSAREALLNIVQASLLNTAQKFSPPLDCGRAVRQARLDAAKTTLFVSPKLIWKNLWPLVMGQLPWADLKALVAGAVASADPKSKPFSSFLLRDLTLAQKAEAFYPLLTTPAKRTTSQTNEPRTQVLEPDVDTHEALIDEQQSEQPGFRAAI
jgi:conjugative relaxase-like TrwC/TraI family protein